MDAEEEDEEEEDDLADVSNQSEVEANQSVSNNTADFGTEKMEEGNEDKENTSILSGDGEDLQTWRIYRSMSVQFSRLGGSQSASRISGNIEITSLKFCSRNKKDRERKSG